MMENNNIIGVIVGRFQVANLTEGHREILDYVLSKNHSVNILFLGIPPKDVRSTKNNPIPFHSRKKMIEDAYPGKFEIYYITDSGTDKDWSDALDRHILTITNNNSNVILYGSRDSFINHYYGNLPTETYIQKVVYSGTNARIAQGKNIGLSEDFRKGCIYATQNSWANYFPTVDCAIFADDSYKQIYLAKKEGEKLFRFPGGFVDLKDESYEAAAFREAKEETGLDCVETIEYVCSLKVDDWRYRQEKEKIMTSLFVLVSKADQQARANDDIAEVHLLDFDSIKLEDIVPTHRPLFIKLKRHLKSPRWSDKSL